MLVIDPEECIDCGACEPECPVEAIFPEDALPAKWIEFTRINAVYLEGADAVDELVAAYCERNRLPAGEAQR
jgi:ferredoxin